VTISRQYRQLEPLAERETGAVAKGKAPVARESSTVSGSTSISPGSSPCSFEIGRELGRVATRVCHLQECLGPVRALIAALPATASGDAPAPSASFK
jgi:hypothetical protein